MTLKALLKKTRFTYILANAIRSAPYPIYAGWMRLCHAVRGVEKNTVYFSSFNGALCDDNPRAIAEALHEICPSAKLVFRVNREGLRQEVPDYITRVYAFSPRGVAAMATARVIVKNANVLPWMRIFPDQKYVQTWHGDRGFKRIGLDLWPDRKDLQRESGWLSLCVSGSDFGSRVYRSAFNYSGEIMQQGYPRNDLLVHPPEGLAASVKQQLDIPPDVRVLLYAPTFRAASSGAKLNAALSLEKVKATLEKATGESWLCLTRSHELNLGIRSDAARDVTGWHDVSALLTACDMVITDYSSIGGDFMLLGRPTVYYQPDVGDYHRERAFYFDMDKSPLIVAHNEGELMEILSRPIDGAENCRECLAFFGASETGHAARSVAEWISKELDDH